MKNYIEIKYKKQTLRGFHHSNKSDEVVVMLHGFTGNKTESKLMYKKLSEALEEVNIDVVRVDYLGHGESDGQFSDMTFQDLLSQADTIITYAKDLGYKTIHLLGFSMGGLIALHKLTPNIKKAIFISPAVNFDINIAKDFVIYSLLPNGNVDIGGYELGYRFKESLESMNVLKYSDTYTNPTLFICGNKDGSVNHMEVERVSKEFRNSQLEIFDNCDHLYSKLSHYAKLESLILDFLQK